VGGGEMTDIDWIKAPEGATHYLADNAKYDWSACWYKFSDNQWMAISVGNRHLWIADNDQVDLFVPMLIAKPGTWNGTGLPPVGTVCEGGRARTGAFNECVVVAHRNGMAIAVFTDQEELQWVSEFRPIRTPEQIAADERDAAIGELVRLYKYGYRNQVGLAAIYDAGYRRKP
jgi:hypothetical protein